MPSWIYIAPVLIPLFSYCVLIRCDQGEIDSNEIDSAHNKKFCHTATCKETAKYLLDNIDDSVDPCDDFYEYACGKWTRTHQLEAGEIQADEFYHLRRKVWKDLHVLLDKSVTESFPSETKLRKLYHQCMDEKQLESLGAQPLLSLLDSVMGGWPVITSDWNASKFDIVETMLHSSLAGHQAFYAVQVVSNETHPESQKMIKINYPPMMGDKAILTDGLMGKLYRDAYLHLLGNITMLLLRDGNGPKVNISMLSTTLEDIVEFEHNLTMTKYCTSGKPEKVQPFNSSVMILMTNVLDAYFSEANITRGNITVYIPDFCFWRKLDEKLVDLEEQGDEGKKRIANLIGWNIILANFNSFPKDYTDVIDEYLRELNGASAALKYTRGEHCAKAVLRALPLVAGNVYVRSLKDPSGLRKQASDLVTRIESEFKELLEVAEWVDTTSRQSAHRKLDSMITMVGYPDSLLNASAIDLEYEAVQIQDNFFQSFGAAMKQRSLRSFRHITLPFTRSDPFQDIQVDVTADFHVLSKFNEIRIGAAILQPPFINTQGPEYRNYGGLGTFVGRCLGTNFDSPGTFLSDQDTRQPWMSDATYLHYLERGSMLTQQYGNYTTSVGYVNGQKTMWGNIADNAGMRVAYRAYMRYLEGVGQSEEVAPELQLFSSQQLYFLSAARSLCTNMLTAPARGLLLSDYRSPPQWRVNGALSNMAEFSQAFNCSSNARMNPLLKTVIF